MIKYLHFLALLLLCNLGVEGQIRFQRTYGEASSCGWFHSMQQTNDGGYVIVGSDSVASLNSDILIIKTNEFGDTLWTRRYGGVLNEGGSSIYQTPDQGYIIAGTTTSFGAGVSDAYMVKTDLSGNIEWEKTYGGSGEDQGNSAIPTSDGGYFLTGSTYSFGGGMGDVYFVKTNSSGDTLWTRVFGENGWDYSYSAKETNDGGFMIVGRVNGLLFVPTMCLYRIDANGNLIWTKTVGGNNVINEIFFIDDTNDGGFAIAGQAAGVFQDACLLKIDSIGTIQWCKTFGKAYQDLAYSVQQTTDHGYILAGLSTNPSSTLNDALLIKTDSTGNMLWNKIFGDMEYERFLSVQQTSDGGYIMAGEISTQKKIFMVKTDPAGNSGCNQTSALLTQGVPAAQINSTTVSLHSGTINTTATFMIQSGGITQNILCSNVGVSEPEVSSLHIAPNPNYGDFKITFLVPLSNVQITIRNIMGQTVYTEKHENSKEINIHLPSIPTGVYLIETLGDDLLNVSRVIIE